LDWQDEGFVLSVRPHGETAAIVSLLTAQHGRHAGLVQGGQSRRNRGLLQVGNRVDAHWRARLEEYLGSYKLELMSSTVGHVLDAPGRLAALASAAALAEAALPEREPNKRLFDSFESLIDALDGEFWGEVYVVWELNLLREIGFGLDLSRCAATGESDDLAYVSPKSARAVSRAAGEPYREKLLPLPAFVLGAGEGGPEAVAEGLALTGFFLERHLFGPRQQRLPDPRYRLAEIVSR
jgi:DNA repair protein RecO (recombination protein O)